MDNRIDYDLIELKARAARHARSVMIGDALALAATAPARATLALFRAAMAAFRRARLPVGTMPAPGAVDGNAHESPH